MKITVAEAVKAGYAPKPTIYRDVKKGRLASSKNRKGTNVLDVADLVELYGEPGTKPTASEKPPSASVTALKAELAMTKAELERARQEADSAKRAAEEERIAAREEREKLYGLVETAQKQLEDMSERSRPGLLSRIFK